MTCALPAFRVVVARVGNRIGFGATPARACLNAVLGGAQWGRA